MFKNIVALISTCSLVFVQTVHASTWTNGLTSAEIEERKAKAIAELNEFAEVAKSIKDKIDVTQFDTDELLDALDYDVEAIVSFVENEISYEPYVGALRGEFGTFLGRAGNPLDQSILLASLLKDAGYEARILQFRLDEETAERLIDSTEITKNVPDHVFQDGTSVSGYVEEQFPELTQEREAELEEYKAQVEESFGYIMAALDENGIELGDENFRARLTSEAQDYFAVEFREAPTDDWQFSHPSAPEVFKNGFDFSAVTNFEDSVSEDWQHQFRFSAHIRVGNGSDEPVDTELFSWTRPTANLTGVELSFTIVPINTDAIREALENLFSQGKFTQEEYLSTLANAQDLEDQVFVPIWNGTPADGAFAFDLSGNILPLDATMQQASELFRTLGGAVGDAATALSGLGTNEEFEVKTESVWLEYAFLEPGREWESHEREIYASDPVREPWEARADVNTLTGAHSFMLSMGEGNKAYLADNYLVRMIAENALIEDIIGTFPEPDLDDMAELAVEHANASNRRHDLLRLHANFDFPFYEFGTRVFKSSPSLTVLSDHLIEESEAGHPLFSHVVDIVRNERSALRVDSKSIAHDPLASIKVGVWESLIESQHATGAAQSFRRHNQKVSSAFFDLRAQFSQQDTTRLPAILGASVLPEYNLKPGELALFSASEEEKGSAWWKIDPQRGSVLAIGSGGRGESVAEYVAFGFLGGVFLLAASRVLPGLAFLALCLSSVFFSATARDNAREIEADCKSGMEEILVASPGVVLADRVLSLLHSILDRRYG
ncbi:MAG: hypothetical protein ACU0GG_05660 [Paracoccaceae bacterium]